MPEEHRGQVVGVFPADHRMADGEAFRRAVAAGYRDVWVMEPGIAGWVEAGHDVARPETREIGS